MDAATPSEARSGCIHAPEFATNDSSPFSLHRITFGFVPIHLIISLSNVNRTKVIAPNVVRSDDLRSVEYLKVNPSSSLSLVKTIQTGSPYILITTARV